MRKRSFKTKGFPYKKLQQIDVNIPDDIDDFIEELLMLLKLSNIEFYTVFDIDDLSTIYAINSKEINFKLCLYYGKFISEKNNIYECELSEITLYKSNFLELCGKYYSEDNFDGLEDIRDTILNIQK